MKQILFLFLSLTLFLFPPPLKAQTLTYTGTNVGVGSANPGQVMDVNGTVRSTAFIVNGFPGVLGSWTSETPGTVYQAATDGFILFTGYNSSGTSTLNCYSDGNNPPTTVRMISQQVAGYNNSITCLVRKGDYWKATDSGSYNYLYFIAIGS